MYPELAGLPLYYVSWLAAALLFVVAGTTSLSRNANLSRALAAAAASLLAASVLVGAKLLYLIESHTFGRSSALVALSWTSGFRLPGGVLLALLLLPLVGRLAGAKRASFAGALAGPAFLSLACIHVGCFVNGCCFGSPTALPWGVRLPPTSFTYELQWRLGLLPLDASASLPSHPLPLYLAAGAVLPLVGVLAKPSARVEPHIAFQRVARVYFLAVLSAELLRPEWLPLNFTATLLSFPALRLLRSSSCHGRRRVQWELLLKRRIEA